MSLDESRARAAHRPPPARMPMARWPLHQVELTVLWEDAWGNPEEACRHLEGTHGSWLRCPAAHTHPGTVQIEARLAAPEPSLALALTCEMVSDCWPVVRLHRARVERLDPPSPLDSPAIFASVKDKHPCEQFP